MKKTLLIVLFLLGGICSHTYAQGIRWGLKGGLAVGTPYGTSIIRTPETSRIGFNAGVFVNIPINVDVLVSPEITYIQKGFTYNGTNVFSDYLQFATTLKVNMGDAPFYTTFGPFVSYLPQVNELAPQQKSLEAGGILGLGYRFSEQVSLEGRYQFSNHIWESPVIERFRNAALDVSLSYLF